jgi:hypothetical protein
MRFSKLLTLLVVLVSCSMLFACKKDKVEEQSETEKIILQAQNMSFDELCRKAIEESNGKTFYGVGNSSRGKKALPNFIAYLQTLNSGYTLKFEWQQPKNNKIFDQLTTDGRKKVGTFAMTLIQDGNQIQSKMVNTGVLDRFIPKEWAAANNITADTFEGFLSLQTLNKVFMYNNTGNKVIDNCWDFVAAGEHGLYMDIDSEIVGKNFLYMLTQDKYATYLKEAYDVLPANERAYFDTTINALAQDAADLGLGANGKYALAWIKLWVESYNAQTDDGPICNTLVQKSATDKFGLLVYSKLRSIEETNEVSKNNITVAAYQQGEALYDNVTYAGIGGFGYSHYLFVTDNSPLPWTACAFIAYMTIINEAAATDADKIAGFSAWGADMGGYSSNPNLAKLNETVYKHKTSGGTTFDCKNDRGYDWWTTTGKLVLEDPEYCASTAFTVGSWIELLTKYTPE